MTTYKYFAFISYSRKDSKVAAWLQNRLEWFRFPVKLVPEDRRPPHERYVRPIYRDKTNLEVTDEHYWNNIRHALEESRYLIVLCSPNSAASDPVDMEVAHFLETHAGDASVVVPVIVSGNVTSTGADAALCPALRALGGTLTDRNLPTMVPDATTAEQDAWEQGFVSLISYLLRLERTALGDHIQRETRRQSRVLRRWLEVVGVLTLVACCAGVLAYINGKEAVDNLAEAQRNALLAKEQEGLAVARGVESEKHASEARANAEKASKNAAEARANAEKASQNAAQAQANEEKANKNAAEAQKQAEKVRAQLREAARSDWVEAVKLLERDRQSEAFAHLARAHRYDPEFILPISTAMLALQDWHVAQPALTIQADGGFIKALFFFNHDTEILTVDSAGLVRRWSATDGKLLAEFRVEEEELSRAVLSPDGRELLTCGARNIVAVWDIATGRSTTEFSAHFGDITEVCFSPDGKHIATASKDGTAILFLNRQSKGIELARRGQPGEGPGLELPYLIRPNLQGRMLLNGGPAVYYVVFSPDGKTIVTGDADGSIKHWNAANGEFLREATMQNAITSIEFSADGARMVTASRDRTAKVWNAKDGKLISTLAGHEDIVHRAHFLISGATYPVATASGDNTLRIWNGEKGQLELTLPQHTDRVLDAIPSPDLGRVVLSHSTDGRAMLSDGSFSIRGMQRQTACEAHGSPVLAAKFSRDGSHFITAGGNGSVMLWEPTRCHFYARERSALDRTESMRGGVDFSLNHDGTMGLTVHEKGALVLWETASGMIRHFVNLFETDLWEQDYSEFFLWADWSPDGKQFATYSSRNKLRLWDAGTCKPVRMLLEGTALNRATWAPDGKSILVARERSSEMRTELLNVWVDGSPPTAIVETPMQAARFLVFSRDGAVFATAHRERNPNPDYSITVWDAVKRKALWTLDSTGGEITQLEFDREHRQLLTVTDDGVVSVWDMQRGELAAEFKSEDAETLAEFSTDGSRLLIAHAKSVQVMDLASKSVVSTLRADHLVLIQALFSEEGKFIVTLGFDRSVRLWDAATGLQVGSFGRTGLNPASMAFSKDGSRLIIVHANGTGTVWDMPQMPEVLPPWWPSFLECMASREFTPDGAMEVLTQPSWAKLRAEVLSAIGMDSSRLAQLARWHLSSHAERTVRPGDARRLDEMFDEIISSPIQRNVLLIDEIQPRHPLAFIAMAPGLVVYEGGSKAQDSIRRAAVEFSVRHLPPDEPTCRRASEMLKKLGYADLSKQALAKSRASVSLIPVGAETLPKKAETMSPPAQSKPRALEKVKVKEGDSFVPVPLVEPMPLGRSGKPALLPVPPVPTPNPPGKP
ncbi:toll/interleukin-1 receptor domain-containing protein [Prosthecobacter fluviatilis]|uniref:Toll/interleukin-1 receptor domain-containing protein n=1 Tax=Prosthecobacter fluviatilis TaxID=445931 RepID=A0ABW0KUK5_9BACT